MAFLSWAFKFPRRPTVFPIVVGVMVGPFAGWAVFSLQSLSGQPFYIAGTTVACVVVGVVIAVFQKRSAAFVLSEVTLSVPEFSEIKFMINREYRRVAWRLFVETMTRIATQPLPKEHGFIREAMNSLHSLFTTSRALLGEMGPSTVAEGTSVEMLAMRMLNGEMRPFLSKWHPALERFEFTSSGGDERGWESNEIFRDELEALRKRLLAYARAFGELAGVAQLEQFFPPTEIEQSDLK